MQVEWFWFDIYKIASWIENLCFANFSLKGSSSALKYEKNSKHRASWFCFIDSLKIGFALSIQDLGTGLTFDPIDFGTKSNEIS